MYEWGGGHLQKTNEEKYVGIMITHTLKLTLQCARTAAKANQVLGQLTRSISYRDKFTFIKLYKVYVRPHIQYCSSAWSLYTISDKELLENVNRRAVKMVIGLTGTYEDKLKYLGLATLEANRVR